MASLAKPEVRRPPEHKCPTLVPPVEIAELRTHLAASRRPEGWVKKVEHAREGKVWVGYFDVVWETTPNGQRGLSPASGSR